MPVRFAPLAIRTVGFQLVAPVFTAQPAITGTEETGADLTLDLGTLNAGTLSGVLSRDDATVLVADVTDGQTYTVTEADEGHVLTLDVTGTNSLGTVTASDSTGTITYAAPGFTFLQSQLLETGTGVQTYDASVGFTVAGDPDLSSVTWSLSTNPDPTNITIDAAGVVSFDTSATGLLDGVLVEVTATNSGGSATSGFTLTVADVPDAFVTGDWSEDGNGDITISTLPADNFDDLTDIEYRVNVGAAQSFGATTTGTYSTGASVGDVLEIRAVNSLGAGAWSDDKTVTEAPATQADVIALFGAGDEGFFYDFSDTSSLYTDLAGTTAVTSSGDPIGHVDDLSGNGNARSAPFTSARPTYTESGGLAYAFMASGGSTRLELDAAISGLTNANEMTIVVAYTTHSDASQRPLSVGNTGSGDYVNINEDIDGSQYRAFQTTGELTVNNTTAPDTSGNAFVVTVMKRGTEGRHYVDGTLVETDTGLSATWDADLSDAGSGAAIRGDSSKIFFVYAINRGLSDTDLDTVHSYAKQLSGVT